MRQGLRWLRRRCPVMPPARQAEIAEEAFYRTTLRWLSDPSLAGRDLVPYYLTVVRNLVADEARAGRPVPMPRAPDSLEAGVRIWTEQVHDDAALLEAVVRPAIRTMRPGQRRTVVEMQSGGADDTAIATAMGISRKQVQIQRVRAIKELREKLRKLIRPTGRMGRRGERDSGE
ncbi:RNA polymerase sigma factor [Streptomyces sp. NPDC093514]|uniref:RNA polymerase sigma factor n=1 Tax=Streptomyces sp. NPDC093514 TaxID=3366039 RepID=UPI0037F60F45